MKKFYLMFVLILLFSIRVNSRPIIEKYIDGCRTNLLGKVKCNTVYQSLVNYSCPTVSEPEKLCSGWSLNCQGKGTTECAIDPNSHMAANVDLVDSYWGIELHDYAINQIENDNVFAGSHSVNVQINDGTIRVYTVTWSIVKSELGDISGSISVTCNI